MPRPIDPSTNKRRRVGGSDPSTLPVVDPVEVTPESPTSPSPLSVAHPALASLGSGTSGAVTSCPEVNSTRSPPGPPSSDNAAGPRRQPDELESEEAIVQLAADGDCFYRAIELATDGRVSVAMSRGRVAAGLTQDHYDALVAAYTVSPREYAFMRRARTLDQLRDRQRLCGCDVGSRVCVWADWAQIQLVATLFQFTILVRDAKAGFSMTISPENTHVTSTDAPSGEKRRYVHVIRVDECHYNVVTIGGHALLSHTQVEASSFGGSFGHTEQS